VALLVRISSRHEHTTTIASRAAHDPRQHARQRRAVARRVVLAVPPSDDHERGPVAQSSASADIRPAYGLHPLRHHRRRCPTELAGATGAAERRWYCAMAMNAERRRALRLLAGSPLGVTEAIMLAHGITIEMLTVLVREGLATAEQREMRAGRRPIKVNWLAITDIGRLALAG
jgi:hypothetical protein